MQVKLLTSIAGYNQDGTRFSYASGAVVELADNHAKRMIAKGRAEAVNRATPRKTSKKQADTEEAEAE